MLGWQDHIRTQEQGNLGRVTLSELIHSRNPEALASSPQPDYIHISSPAGEKAGIKSQMSFENPHIIEGAPPPRDPLSSQRAKVRRRRHGKGWFDQRCRPQRGIYPGAWSTLYSMGEWILKHPSTFKSPKRQLLIRSPKSTSPHSRPRS